MAFFYIHYQGCEKELAEAQKGQDEGFKKESIMRLSWALVHSKMPADIQRGIAMLEGIYNKLICKLSLWFL